MGRWVGFTSTRAAPPADSDINISAAPEVGRVRTGDRTCVRRSRTVGRRMRVRLHRTVGRIPLSVLVAVPGQAYCCRAASRPSCRSIPVMQMTARTPVDALQRAEQHPCSGIARFQRHHGGVLGCVHDREGRGVGVNQRLDLRRGQPMSGFLDVSSAAATLRPFITRRLGASISWIVRRRTSVHSSSVRGSEMPCPPPSRRSQRGTPRSIDDRVHDVFDGGGAQESRRNRGRLAAGAANDQRGGDQEPSTDDRQGLEVDVRRVAQHDRSVDRQRPALLHQLVVSLLHSGLIVLLVLVELLQLRRRERNLVVGQAA